MDTSVFRQAGPIDVPGINADVILGVFPGGGRQTFELNVLVEGKRYVVSHEIAVTDHLSKMEMAAMLGVVRDKIMKDF